MTTKADIRKMMIEKRQAVPREAHAELSRAVCDNLVAIPIAQQNVVAGYKSVRGEVDIVQAMLAAHDKKFALCLPSVAPPERIMAFLRWQPKMAMHKGALGILEPDQHDEVMPTTLWIPLVAFDRTGYRLGYGGGYYDATLTNMRKTHPEIRTVGVAFAFQEVDVLPRDVHDVRLDFMVTEKEIISL